MLLQMYATAAFGFGQGENGWLMSGNAFARSVFLIFMFPRIIGAGRSWFSSRARRSTRTTPEPGVVLPTDPRGFDAPTGTQSDEEPVVPDKTDEKAAFAFDLLFLRWSLVVDGALTAGAAFATRSWHMYLGQYRCRVLRYPEIIVLTLAHKAALLLPFGSGSAPAAKGVITSMCPNSQRTDALNAITLVENIARLSTLGLFGFIFSAFAEMGEAYLTFFCNGVSLLVLARRLRWHVADLGASGHCSRRNVGTPLIQLSSPG